MRAVVDKRLSEALESGPFSLALRLAVRASGLSLERIQVRLRERGAPVSKTALSNWQSGRTQPERAESLRALGVLEEVLGVGKGRLSGLLGPPRPRGRWLTRRPGDLRPDQAWARPDGLARALRRMGSELDAINVLGKVGLQISGRVNAERRLHAVTHNLVVRAERDNVDRYTGAFRTDLDSSGPPRITEARGCRLGRQRGDAATGFFTFELLLDQPLRAGEVTTLEYTLRPAINEPDTYHSQRVAASMRVYSVLIHFDRRALPARVYRGYVPAVGDRGDPEVDLAIGASGTARFAVVDPTAGIYRIDWDWE